MSLFLDSGAFSAYTKKVEININEYIQFIKDHIDFIDVYANLDVIGNAEASYKNQKYMEDNGLHPIPTFHLNSDKKWLQFYVDNYEYIAIGGLAVNFLSGNQLLRELDNIFKNYVCDKEGMPKIKVHGFGLTRVKLLIRYPWYSVDSTSWLMRSRFGWIYMPSQKYGKYNYLTVPISINFSSRSSVPIKENYNNGISPILKKQVDKYLEEKNFVIGKSEFDKDGKEIIIKKGLINDYRFRDIANITYYQDLERALPEYPWKFIIENRQKGFNL